MKDFISISGTIYADCMEPLKIHHPHDHLVRESLKRINIARGIIETVVNPQIRIQLNLSSLEIVNTTWINDSLNEYRADILYRALLMNGRGYLYFLFEHKSKSDNDVYWQI